MKPTGIIALTTDFGVRDGFVGMMKGVMLGINPDARIVDLIHEIPPQDITAAAFLVGVAWPYFPAGTTHLVVVDPGVGSGRRALAIQCGEQYFVAPDNGVLSELFNAFPKSRAYELANWDFFLDKVSRTFHGRDLFAPVTAHISKGLPLNELGPVIDDPVRLDYSRAARTTDGIEGEIRYIDHFGNCMTNIAEEFFNDAMIDEASYFVRCRRQKLALGTEAYADAEPGDPLAIFNSFGVLEIAVNQGSAADRLKLRVGDKVTITKSSPLSSLGF